MDYLAIRYTTKGYVVTNMEGKQLPKSKQSYAEANKDLKILRESLKPESTT